MGFFSFLFRRNKSNGNSNDTTTNDEKNKNGKTEQSRGLPIIGPNSIMSRKQHGTSDTPVQKNLRWSVDRNLSNRICNHNRHGAEHFGYFQKTKFPKHFQNRVKVVKERGTETQPYTFYDSNTGKPLFFVSLLPSGTAGLTKGRRSHHEFWQESVSHGWPSFRDYEVNWENVRCLKNGECVSLDGTHLGHNLPDRKGGNRYCINLVSIAGRPDPAARVESEVEDDTEEG